MAIWRDLRFGMRVVLTHPGFSAIVILVLALGIGANTAVFTLVNAVLVRGLPFDHGDRIMVLSCSNFSKGWTRMGVSYPDFQDWRKDSRALEKMAAWGAVSLDVSDHAAKPERYTGSRISADSFPLLGVQPVIGRDFSPQDDLPGAAPVALLGHAIWKNRYGGGAGILGQTIRLNDIPTTVIGVMPEGFRFPLQSDLWIPLIPSGEMLKRDDREIVVFGRLAEHVPLDNAQAEMNLLAQRLAKQYPASNEDISVQVYRFNDAFNSGPIRTLFLSLLGAVGFVLLIACANVASLMLSRSLSRTQEMSIRTALGAGRWLIVRQLLVESFLFSAAGGLLGLALAVAGVRAFDLAVAAVSKPYWIRFTMDFRVFAYLAVITLGTTVLFGLVPAWNASGLNLGPRLKESSRGTGVGARTRVLSGALVVIELALSVILLAGAGLMIRSFLKVYGMQGSVNSANLLTMRINLAEIRYPTEESRRKLYDRLLIGLAAVPGVDSVALATNPPLGGSLTWRFELEGHKAAIASKPPRVSGMFITADYFRAMGVSLVRGRAFNSTDGTAGRSSVIVNQRFAAKNWPGQDPLGRRLLLTREHAHSWSTVIGVSPDLRQNDPMDPEIEPLVYLPYREDAVSSATILARTRIDPQSLITDLREQVQAVDGTLPVFNVQTLDRLFDQQRWAWRVFGVIFLIFASIALLLSAVGIYGVIAYSVAQRTRELGVRMALGASARDILALVLASGAAQAGIGLAVGVAGALAATRVMRSLLVQVSPADPLTYAIVTGILGGAALLACWIPARRALRIDPIIVLHCE